MEAFRTLCFYLCLFLFKWIKVKQLIQQQQILMEKIKFGETKTLFAEASTALQPKPSGAQITGHAEVQEKVTRTDGRQNLLIHGLAVERYREIFNSVLNPFALTALKSCKPSDYVCQVQELKQQLWMKMGRPRLKEILMEGGLVEFTEVLDLT